MWVRSRPTGRGSRARDGRIRWPVLMLCLCVGPGVLAAQQPADTTVLTLPQAMELAQKQNEAVGIAEAGVLRARGNQTTARSGWLPQLSGSATYTRTLRSQFSGLRSGSSDTTSAPSSCPDFIPDSGLPIANRVDSLEQAVNCLSTVSPFSSFRNLPFGQPNSYNFGLSLSQTVFDYGLMGQVKAAGAGRDAAGLALRSQRAQLQLTVTSAYFDAVLADRLLAIAEEGLAQAERTFQDTRKGYQVGTQPEFELLRARVNRDNQRPLVIQRRAQRDLARDRLKQLLNLPLEAPVALATTLGDSGQVELPRLPLDLPAEPDTGMASRVLVRQAEANVRAQEGLAQAATGARLPSLAISSQYAKITFPASGLPFNSSYLTDWTITVRLSVPLYLGGRLHGQRMVARANLDEARLRLSLAEKQAALDTRDAVLTLQAAEAAWEASAGTAEQARRAYDIAEIRFREGISTQTELSDSRLALRQAEANRATAARDLQVARVRLALLPDLPAQLGSGAATGMSQAAQAGGGNPAASGTTGGQSAPRTGTANP